MLKKKLLLYTDCYIFGGSERLMTFLVKNEILIQSFNVFLSYNNHKGYRHGIKREFSKPLNGLILLPLPILCRVAIGSNLDRSGYSKILQKVLKKVSAIMHYLGIFFINNLIQQIIFLQKIKPEIVHINNGGYPAAQSCNTMVLASKICGIKAIVYQANNIALKPRVFFVEKYLDRFINKNVSVFITASFTAKKALAENRLFNPSKIIRIPNMVIDEKCNLQLRKLFESHSIPEDSFVICNVAFLTNRKGQKYLLDAIVKIREQNPVVFNKIHSIFIGDGEDAEKLKTMATINKIDDHVHFLGYQNNFIEYVGISDLFILPSIAFEDMPLVILSAMSLGKTIVATRFSGIKEAIEHGISGILLDPDTESLAPQLSRTILDLFAHPNSSLGIEARKRYELYFSPASYGTSLLKVYQNLLKI